MRKFAGREAQLCAKLRKKYGATPDFSLPREEEEKSRPEADASAYQRGFKPYSLTRRTGGALDLRAPEFDALKALSSPSVPLLVSNAFPLDNIQKCRPMVRVPSSLNRCVTTADLHGASCQRRTRIARAHRSAPRSRRQYQQVARHLPQRWRLRGRRPETRRSLSS